ncbi:flagellar protein FlaG [Treponema pedis]|nr:flagellar protein FlaG [Treponema pedis]QOW60003.1 flagellar protein FlaG [Treponema pedis]QSI05343.1 flagellar biosynthesis protein FlaG [Treponema pedis]
MSIEVTGIGHQTALQNRQKEQSVNIALKEAVSAIKKAEEKTDVQITDPKTVSKAVEEIQKLCNMCGRKLQFRVNTDTNRIVVKVIDTSTDKVIREIPSEEIQRLQARIRETVGLLFDETI